MDQLISQNITNKLTNIPQLRLKFIIILDIIYNILNDIENPYSFSSVINNLKKNGLYNDYKNKMKTLNGWDNFTNVFNSILIILDMRIKKYSDKKGINYDNKSINNSTINQYGSAQCYKNSKKKTIRKKNKKNKKNKTKRK